MEQLLREKGYFEDFLKMYLSEVKSFSRLRIGGLLNTTSESSQGYHFDFAAIVKKRYDINPREYFVETPLRIHFGHSESQRKEMEGYMKQYGTNTLALGRILMRAHIKTLSTPAPFPSV